MAWLPWVAIVGSLVASSPQSTPPPASCLVMPFENRSRDATLDWMAASFVASVDQTLQSSAATVLDARERGQALELAGVPEGVPVSHATMIRLAEAADVRWLVTGWYDYDGDRLRVGGWVFDLKREHLVPMAVQNGRLQDLELLQQHFDWAVRQQISPCAACPAADQAAAPPMPLPAYENYIRATTQEGAKANVAIRLKELKTAAALAPSDPRVQSALGQAYLGSNDPANALRWLLKVPEGSSLFPQAQFSAGLAAYRLRHYPQAEALFAALAARLPLAEVVANAAAAKAAVQLPAGQKPPPLATAFPAAGFRQLQGAVAQFDQSKQSVRAALDQGRGLLQQGALDGAANAFDTVLHGGIATPQQLGEAHAGLASIAWQRNDRAHAATEVAAALAADPSNAQALALRQAMEAPHA